MKKLLVLPLSIFLLLIVCACEDIALKGKETCILNDTIRTNGTLTNASKVRLLHAGDTQLTPTPIGNLMQRLGIKQEDGVVFLTGIDGEIIASFSLPITEFLKDAYYDTTDKSLVLVFLVNDSGQEVEKTVTINASDLNEYSASNGLQLSNDQFSIKLDAETENYIAVSESGLKLTGINSALAGKADTYHTHTFSEITSKPTTLSGYGITDANFLPLSGGTLTGILTLRDNTDGDEDDISNVYNPNEAITTNPPQYSASIRNALSFKWFDTDYQIGNVRGSSTNSVGFGITQSNNNLLFRVSENGNYNYGDLSVVNGSVAANYLEAGYNINSDITETFRTSMFGNSAYDFRLKSFRNESTVVKFGAQWSSGIAFAGGDRHGFIIPNSVNKGIKVGAGALNTITWTDDIALLGANQTWTGEQTFNSLVTASSFINSNSNNNYVLLGGGGTKAVSDFAGSAPVSYASSVSWVANAYPLPVPEHNIQIFLEGYRVLISMTIGIQNTFSSFDRVCTFPEALRPKYPLLFPAHNVDGAERFNETLMFIIEQDGTLRCIDNLSSGMTIVFNATYYADTNL
ncbi:hypothetical protein EZS27_027358 [termite gut metagenome]|uniref:Uncharacterized protein n=1 Tax=termite gut metagenome TaxID=433724 RepID=A0A5J4QQ21_9ZZZZ